MRIAKTAYTHDLKVSLIPSDLVLNLRFFVREYYNLTDAKTKYVDKLHKDLRLVFPGYIKIFSSLTGKTSLLILKTYRTPENILAASKGEVISLIALTSCKRLKYANEKYSKLIDATKLSKSFGHYLESVFELIQMHIELIEIFSRKIDSILASIEKYTLKFEQHTFIKQIHLLDSVKGIGFISAVKLMCEIGDFPAFLKPEQLYAYFGLDPAVKESRNFKGTKVSMSKVVLDWLEEFSL